MMIEGYPRTVTLKDGTKVTIRPLAARDEASLKEFFLELPEEDRQFLREDATRPEVVERFIRTLGDETVFPLIAEHAGRIAGDATLHRDRHGWSTHVAQIRVVVAREFQHKGLGTALARCLVRHAIGIGLDKLVAEVVENQHAAKRAFEKLGFVEEAVLKGHVRDIHGIKRNLVILANDCSQIWETMEALVSDFSPTHGG